MNSPHSYFPKLIEKHQKFILFDTGPIEMPIKNFHLSMIVDSCLFKSIDGHHPLIDPRRNIFSDK